MNSKKLQSSGELLDCGAHMSSVSGGNPLNSSLDKQASMSLEILLLLREIISALKNQLIK